MKYITEINNSIIFEKPSKYRKDELIGTVKSTKKEVHILAKDVTKDDFSLTLLCFVRHISDDKNGKMIVNI